MAALARTQGQPYAMHHRVASSFGAHRMLHLAGHGAVSEFTDAVQRDLLGEGVNLHTAAYLANAATRAAGTGLIQPPLTPDGGHGRGTATATERYRIRPSARRHSVPIADSARMTFVASR